MSVEEAQPIQEDTEQPTLDVYIPPIYNIIVAVEVSHGGFSNKGNIPWYYSEDFQWFKEKTMECPCIMGRRTYEDINKRLGDKAKESVLPNRQCFVVSRSLQSLPNATVIPNIRNIEHQTYDRTKPIYIIGGERLFIEGIAFASNIYLTVINKEIECDLFFPLKYMTKNFVIKEVLPSTNKELAFLHLVRR